MKKAILSIAGLFIFLSYYGCEKSYDSLVDQSVLEYQVSHIGFIGSKGYSSQDSLILLTVSFDNAEHVSSVFADIYASDGAKLNTSRFNLLDNGVAANGDSIANDNVYSNKFPLSQFYPNGNYLIKYFVEDRNNFTRLVGQQSFKYFNGQGNSVPVISDLVAPDSAKIGSTPTLIFLSVKVEDLNGLNDIDLVFFNSFLPPDGRPSSSNPFKMYDDGTNGDKNANDGIFSLIVQLPPGSAVTRGIYRWEFQARDRSSELSNKVIHNIVIY
jgi:hypothetical protein